MEKNASMEIIKDPNQKKKFLRFQDWTDEFLQYWEYDKIIGCIYIYSILEKNASLEITKDPNRKNEIFQTLKKLFFFQKFEFSNFLYTNYPD